uniref:SLC12 domain-containing protein n=1 Tax=Caenorhabditis tropicalis TaxID=1561998 RepID=A0A1I7TZG2_9PELO
MTAEHIGSICDWVMLTINHFFATFEACDVVIILNASHIYLMGDFDFRRFFLHLLANNAERCGIRICDTHTDLREVTLAQLQERNQRIIIIGPTDQNVDDICFRSTCLQNKWPNLNNTVQLLKYLQAEIHTPVTPGLRVLQSVITPKMSDIFRNLRGSLKTIFSLEMRTILKIWLRRLNEEEIGNMNILISDQVDNEYCRLVYYLNVADCPEHVLDEHFTNPHLEEMPTDTIVDEILWPGKKDLETVELCKTEEMKDEEFKACKEEDKIEEAVNSLPVIKQVEEPDRYRFRLPAEKPNRTSVMLQQIEMVLVTDTSSEGTSTATRSPIPPPKPKRHTQRIPIVMEVVPIPDVAIPTYYNDMPSVPISRSSDTPVRIALPVTEEELRLAALGEYQPYGSLRSQRLSERRSVQVKEEEEEESADESSPLISHEVESMVEDLIINSTIDVMDNLASKFKEY